MVTFGANTLSSDGVGESVTFDLDEGATLWQANFTGIYLNDTNIAGRGNGTVVLDSAYSYIGLPLAAYVNFFTAINNTDTVNITYVQSQDMIASTSACYEITDDLPNLVIETNGQKFTISPDAYVLDKMPFGAISVSNDDP